MQLLNLHFLLGFVVALLILLSVYIIYKYLFEYKRVERKLLRMASFPEQNPNPIVEVSLKGRILYTNPAARACFPDLLVKGFTHPLFNLARERLNDFKSRDLRTHEGTLHYSDRLFELNIFSLRKTRILRVYCVDITENRKRDEFIRRNTLETGEYIQFARRVQQDFFGLEIPATGGKLDSFVLSVSKEAAGGDFHWHSSLAQERTPGIVLAAVDCAGHGVKGAFRSVIVHSLLDRIVANSQVSHPSEILEKLQSDMHRIQEDKEEIGFGALEIAVCIIDLQELRMEFAGAGRSLYHVKNGNLRRIAGDRRAVGGYRPVKNTFTDHAVKLDRGDTVYLFSNGFADQFGGPLGKKLKRAGFGKLLLQVAHLGLHEQRESLKTAFEQWKGSNEQVDDMLILGIRLK